MLDTIVEHAIADAPNECCGLVVGSGRTARSVRALENLAASPFRFDIDGVVKGIGDLRSQADVANFAIELELAAVAAYYDAHAKLVDAKLLQTGAAIMANEAQHLVVLRQAAKQDPVPHAFETGEK